MSTEGSQIQRDGDQSPFGQASAAPSAAPQATLGGVESPAASPAAARSGADQTAVVQLMSLWAGSGGHKVQRRAKGSADQSGADVQTLANQGISGTGSGLPYGAEIAAAFGKHDVGSIKAHVGGAAATAAQSIGAQAYATGNDVAFSSAPDLHTAAHEAAHVVQQRAGVQLKGGVGTIGDNYEQHADQVADAVVAGKFAEPILDKMAGPTQSGQGQGAVQKIGVPLDQKLPEGAAVPEFGEDKGQQRRYSPEQYEAMWEKEQGHKLTEAEKKTIDRGCIGITANNLHGGGNPPLDNAYSTFEAAHASMVKMNEDLDKQRKNPATAALVAKKHAVLFAKMFWSNQSSNYEKRKKPDDKAFLPDEKTGKVDMTGYAYREQPGYVNFDYAFWDESSSSFWHANHCQPDMHVYQSTKERFAKGYIDFDRVIYCATIAENYDPGLAAIVHVGTTKPPAGHAGPH